MRNLILFGGLATSHHSTSHPDPTVCREGDLMLELAALGWASSSPAFRQVFVSRFLPDAIPSQWKAFDEMLRFEQGRRLASLIPGARFVPLPGRNHIPFPQEPAWAALGCRTRAEAVRLATERRLLGT